MNFAEALHALMAERGISGRALARLVHCDAALICRYRSGKQPPSAKMAALIDDALGAEGALVAEAVPRPGRRAVLVGGLVAGGLLAVGPDSLELLAWPGHQPRIDTAVVDALAGLLAAHRRADDAVGSAVMLRPALAQLGAVEDLVRQARGPVRPALLSVAEGWAQFAGWLCRNSADFAGAELRFGQALEWAEELGDQTMISTVLANKSLLAAYSGDTGAAVGLAQAAQRNARAAAGQRAIAAHYEARGHALAGDAEAAERKLGEAQGLAAALPRDQRPWLYWLTPEFFGHESGITCTYLAADPRWHARAVALLETPAEPPGGLWAPAQNLTYLASAHAQGGEVDQACAVAVKASGIVRRSGSARCAAMLARIHADLQARYPGDPRVTELADALA